MPNRTVAQDAVLADSKYVYFAAEEQTTISWRDIPCDISDVASKAYFKVY